MQGSWLMTYLISRDRVEQFHADARRSALARRGRQARRQRRAASRNSDSAA